jgi:hypothetical protein
LVPAHVASAEEAVKFVEAEAVTLRFWELVPLTPVNEIDVGFTVSAWAKAWKGAVNNSAGARRKTILLVFVSAASMVVLDSFDDNRPHALLTKKLGYVWTRT